MILKCVRGNIMSKGIKGYVDTHFSLRNNYIPKDLSNLLPIVFIDIDLVSVLFSINHFY